jgi:hypothetical protein
MIGGAIPLKTACLIAFTLQKHNKLMNNTLNYLKHLSIQSAEHIYQIG